MRSKGSFLCEELPIIKNIPMSLFFEALWFIKTTVVKTRSQEMEIAVIFCNSNNVEVCIKVNEVNFHLFHRQNELVSNAFPLTAL